LKTVYYIQMGREGPRIEFSLHVSTVTKELTVYSPRRRGGARPGAGRKRGEKTEIVSLRLLAKEVKSYREQAKRRKISLSKLLVGMLARQIKVREFVWPDRTQIIDVEESGPRSPG
jgi:hypothetical protein